MKLHAKTWALLALTALLLLLNFTDSGSGERLAAELPVIPAIDKTEATRVEISSAIEKVILERSPAEGDDPGRWGLTAPAEGDADQILVRSLLNQFRKEASVDIKVDEGNLDEYGLDAGNGIVVEIWTTGEDPAISLTVGFDAPGGSSFVRLSGDDAIYRARVGGRRRVERRGSDWRNAVILDVASIDVAGVEVENQAGGFTLVRGASSEMDDDGLPVPGEWTLDPTPEWPVDVLAAEAMVRGLGNMRAGDMLDGSFDGGFETPLARARFVMANTTTRSMVVGSRGVDGGAFIKVDDRDEVFRVSRSTIEPLLVGAEELRNKSIFRFERGNVDTMALDEDGTSILLQQDLSNGLWRVIQPANIDVDLKLVFYSINTLAELRAHDFSATEPAAAGLTSPSARVVMRLLDGSNQVLNIGDPTTDEQGRPCFYVSRGDDPQVYLLRDTTIARIKQGFGRS